MVVICALDIQIYGELEKISQNYHHMLLNKSSEVKYGDTGELFWANAHGLARLHVCTSCSVHAQFAPDLYSAQIHHWYYIVQRFTNRFHTVI